MPQHQGIWKRTIAAHERVKSIFEPAGMYQGRHIIGRDTTIDGGVSIGAYEREAIVVDSQHHPAIRQLYEKTKSKTERHGQILKGLVLNAVYDVVLETFPAKDDGAVDQLVRSFGEIPRDTKIALDTFINEGMGVCRHLALTAGVLLELFARDRYIGGRASVDRNEISAGAREWARYVNTDRDIIIIDAALGYCGPLHNPQIPLPWPYYRPGE